MVDNINNTNSDANNNTGQHTGTGRSKFRPYEERGKYRAKNQYHPPKGHKNDYELKNTKVDSRHTTGQSQTADKNKFVGSPDPTQNVNMVKTVFRSPKLLWMAVPRIYVSADTNWGAENFREINIGLYFYGGNPKELIKVGKIMKYGVVVCAPFLFADEDKWKEGKQIDRTGTQGTIGPIMEALKEAWDALEKVIVFDIPDMVAMKSKVNSTGQSSWKIYMQNKGIVGNIDFSGRLYENKGAADVKVGGGAIVSNLEKIGDGFIGKVGIVQAIRILKGRTNNTSNHPLTELYLKNLVKEALR